MAEITDLFPRPLGKPNNGRDLLKGKWRKLPYLSWRNKNYLDSLRPFTLPPVAIASKGIDFKGRTNLNDPDIVKLFFSFPRDYVISGSDNIAVKLLGNSVPPLMMYAISGQVRHVLCGGQPINMNKKIDYSAHLEAMWKKAIAPRESSAPTVISAFAGGGGSLTGYMMAGFRDLLAIEWDDNAVETLRLNWPELDIYHGDIAKITVNEVLERTGLKPRELDILDGSPPCQGFSTAGKRIMNDPRNQLFREYVRLLRGLQPKVFIMENVSGLVKGKMKLVFVEILKELKASGYKVSAKMLNAMYFHVPQSRQRLIFIGVREDFGIEPSHPKAEGKSIIFRDACIGAPNEGMGLSEMWKKIAKYQPILWSSKPYIWRRIKGNLAGSLNTKWAIEDKCCGTLIKQWIAGTGIIHPNRERYINLFEARRIGSFPNCYHFPGTFLQGIERIGNSVPPLFMEAIARHVRVNILAKATAIYS